MSIELKSQLDFATNLAREAGVTIMEYFEGDQEVEIKNDNSPVTIADKLINQRVMESILEVYPDHGVVGEEASTDKEDQEFVWFCDPIDGTKAFIWGLPTAMFSLALVFKGRPILGTAYDPFQDRMYTALSGQGAFCNGEPIHVSSLDLTNGILAASADEKKLFGERYRTLSQRGVRLAIYSGYVHKAMSVARGRLVGHAEDNVSRHDIAAAEVIIKEAGGKVTNFGGQPLDYRQSFRGVVISNGIVHDELLKIAQIK